jgi:hypothetical protein
MGKGTKGAHKPVERAEKPPMKAGASEPLSDPLRAFPADPPQQNLLLLIASALLFAIWFCYLAYVALRA